MSEASQRFVQVEPVAARESTAFLNAPARLAFGDGAVSRVGAPLPGRVAQVHVRVGEQVEADQPLVTLDCPEAASSRAELAAARASVKEARASMERQVRMLEQGVGTERERLLAETRVAEVEAELARAEAAVRFVGSASGTRVVLRSPLAGTVMSRAASVGAAVEPGGDPLIEVGDPSQLWAIADVFERDLPLVREGASVEVELPSQSLSLAGRVASVAATLEGGARTAQVRVALEQKSESLRPGMFGRARIESSQRGIAIPTDAVLIKGGKRTVVYVERAPGSFLERAVVIARPFDGKVLVTSGLSAGDRVAVKGALLIDGAADQLL